MVDKLTLNMITQRSIEEGVAMEKGKTTQEYFEACSIIELNEEDSRKLGLVPNQLVKVTSECGSVVVKSVKGRQTLYPGLAFIPQGVWANQIVPARTQATGEPQVQWFSRDGRTRKRDEEKECARVRSGSRRAMER